MALLHTVRFIVSHPLGRKARWSALSRFARWQIGSRILPGGAVVEFVGGTRLLVRPSMTGATGNIYVGIHDFEEMGFLLHFLRSGDLFADVGANVGAYTVLAAGACGARARSFEPVSSAFEDLRDNIALNRLGERVVARKVVVGASTGSAQMSCDQDTVNHVVTERLDGAAAVETVPQVRLDDEFEEAPAVVKIDVEGFESQVLAGMPRLLASNALLAVIMELNASGARYGVEDRALRRTMSEAGFVECCYDPLRRALEARPAGFEHPGNSIFIRRRDAVEARIASAPRVVVLGIEF
ncbi:MAG TPA: FkbM family methyltransferase [Myxococcota bacterium]|jgi:FkbM family methyltransferase